MIWKDQAIGVEEGTVYLPNGLQMPILALSIPVEYQDCDIRRAELTWRADHYELCLTIDTGIPIPALLEWGKTIGVDLGEINIAAAVTEDGEGVVISGRHLRSIQRLRNKRLAAYQSRIERCKNGSKRKRKLLQSKRKASAQYEASSGIFCIKPADNWLTFARNRVWLKLRLGMSRIFKPVWIWGGKATRKSASYQISEGYSA